MQNNSNNIFESNIDDISIDDGFQEPSFTEQPKSSMQIQKTLKVDEVLLCDENEYEINVIPNRVDAAIVRQKSTKYKNPFACYFPVFYIKEMRYAMVAFILSAIFLGVFTILSAVGIYWFCTNKNGVSPWLSLFATPAVGIPTIITIIYAMRFVSYKQESKSINFKNEKVVSLNIQKNYKRLKTTYIDVNWAAAAIYLLSAVTLIITCTVAWAVYKGTFGDMSKPLAENNYVYISLFWGTICIFIITFIWQIFMIVSNYFRFMRIENFYNFAIVPDEEIKSLKKQKNRRDLVIFMVSTAVITLLGFLVYKFIKRGKTTNVIVK